MIHSEYKQVYRLNIYFMNKIILFLLFSFLLLSVYAKPKVEKKKYTTGKEYAVIAGEDVMNDPEWEKVVEELQKKHQALLFQYKESPSEILQKLQKNTPRYVAFVEKPENIGADYVKCINQLSRQVDEDIFADFLWGIITGYDANSAMKMVKNATNPLVVRNMLSTSAFRDASVGEWFERYAWMDDFNMGMWGQKKANGDIDWQGLNASGSVQIDAASGYAITEFQPVDYFDKFISLYQETMPDCFLTNSYSTNPRWNSDSFSMSDFHPVSKATAFQSNLPFCDIAAIKAKNGYWYADYPEAKPLPETGKPKVYIAAGDNFGGDVAHSKESMSIAWMSGGNAAAVIGYVAPNWFGIGSFGIVKYWITNAGRYSLPEAAFLNRQHIISLLNRWHPTLATMNFPYTHIDQAIDIIATTSGIKNPTRAEIGCLYDRDVMAYYGDPKWNVRLQEHPGSRNFTVTSEQNNDQYIITIVTHSDFTMQSLAGNHYQPECTLDLPFSYFFPQRLPNAHLADGQKWDIALDENFIFVYNTNFEPNQTYRIVLKMRTDNK